MANSITPLVAGNWKMNGMIASSDEARAMAAGLADLADPKCDVLICPPATLIGFLARVLGESAISLGAQDCHPQPGGAHTGDIAAEMLADVGATTVIVGHSERRQDHGETDALVASKAQAAWRAGLKAIICVGESEAERDAGDALTVVRSQLEGSVPPEATASDTIIAYEPIWAIGTGRTPTPADVAEVHDAVRETLKELLRPEGEGMRILYGGSVKPGNAAELMSASNVNGALVGGASLKAEDFLGIIRAYS